MTGRRESCEAGEEGVEGWGRKWGVGLGLGGGLLALTLPAPDAGQGGGRMVAWAEAAARGSSTGGGSSGCLRSDWCGER